MSSPSSHQPRLFTCRLRLLAAVVALAAVYAPLAVAQGVGARCMAQPYWITLAPVDTPMGSTTRYSGDMVGSCTTQPGAQLGIAHRQGCGAGMPAAGYAWSLEAVDYPRQVQVTTCGITTRDTVITVIKGCDSQGQVVACEDDHGTAACALQSSVGFLAEAGALYTVFVRAKHHEDCVIPKIQISISEPTGVPAAFESCPASIPHWTVDGQLNLAFRQLYGKDVGQCSSAAPISATSPTTTQPGLQVDSSQALAWVGVEHAPTCTSSDVDLSTTSRTAHAWTFSSTADQEITVTSCIDPALKLMPLLTARSGCQVDGQLMGCTGDNITRESCGIQTQLSFQVGAGEVFTVFAQHAVLSGFWLNATTPQTNSTRKPASSAAAISAQPLCWTSPGISVSAPANLVFMPGSAKPVPPPPAFISYPPYKAPPAPPTVESSVEPGQVAAGVGAIVAVMIGVCFCLTRRWTSFAPRPPPPPPPPAKARKAQLDEDEPSAPELPDVAIDMPPAQHHNMLACPGSPGHAVAVLKLVRPGQQASDSCPAGLPLRDHQAVFTGSQHQPAGNEPGIPSQAQASSSSSQSHHASR